TVSLSIQGLEGATMTGTALDQPGEDGTQIALDPDRLKELHVFVRQARGSSTASNQSFLFVVEDIENGERAEYSATFISPEASRRCTNPTPTANSPAGICSTSWWRSAG